MSKNNELFKNTIVITVGRLSTQLISFLLLPLYTSMLTADEYGIVDLFATYTSLLIPLIIFQIDQAFFRFLIDVRKDEKDKKNVISTICLFAIIQCLIVFIIFLIVHKYISNQYKWFLLTNIISTIFSSLMLQVARGMGNNIVYSFASFLSAFIQIVCNVVFIAILKIGVDGMFIATFIGNIICGIYIFLNLKINQYISIRHFSFKELKRILKYSVPLIPNALSWWAITASDRIIITAYMGIAANGLLSIAHKFSSFYISFYNIFNISWTESASLHINDEDKEEFFSGVINTMFRLFIGCALCIISVMPFIFPIMINSTYHEAYYQIPIFMIAAIFNVVIGLYSVVYVALKKTKEIAKTSIFSGIINILVNLILIRYIGLYAASVSSALGYGVMAIYRHYDVKKYIKIYLDIKMIAYTTIILIANMISYYNKNIYLQLIMCIITIGYFIIINIKMVLKVLSILKKYSLMLKDKFL